MKHKVSELEGALLDAAVAKAEGLSFIIESHPTVPPKPRFCWLRDEKGNPLFTNEPYEPSTRWAQAGPIIEEELIFFSELPMHDGGPEVMVARCGRTEARGRGHLIAAMRAYVASKFGDVVELP